MTFKPFSDVRVEYDNDYEMTDFLCCDKTCECECDLKINRMFDCISFIDCSL